MNWKSRSASRKACETVECVFAACLSAAIHGLLRGGYAVTRINSGSQVFGGPVTEIS